MLRRALCVVYSKLVYHVCCCVCPVKDFTYLTSKTIALED